MIDENRVQCVQFGQRHFLELFQGPGQCVALRLDHPRLPADAKVVAIHHDWCTRSFQAVVSSASFPEVPPGEKIPLFDPDGGLCNLSVRYVDGDRLTPNPPDRRTALRTWDSDRTFIAVASQDIRVGETLIAMPPVSRNMSDNELGKIAVRLCPPGQAPTCIALEAATKGDWLKVQPYEHQPKADDPQAIKAGDKVYTPMGPGTAVPADVVNAADETSFASVNAEAEFFRKSIMAE